MKHTAGLFLLLLLACFGASGAETNILPRPAIEHEGAGGFVFNDSVAINADSEAASSAAGYFRSLLRKSGFADLKPNKGGRTISFALAADPVGDAESYRLTIRPDRITIRAPAPAGLFYGGISLWQMIVAKPTDRPVRLNDVEIIDAPRFAWRGLMIDSARHFQSPSYIEGFIDWMAIHKLNILHWHLTDDQGWRIEIKRYPQLTEIGGWRIPAGADGVDSTTGAPRKIGGFYRQEEIRAIVAYAAERHVTIIPEIDMPGHATAAIAALPELGVPDIHVSAPSSDWGVHHNLLNVDDATFTRIENILDEVLTLFPAPYIHIGGDEAVKDQWRSSQAIRTEMSRLGITDYDQLQGYFIHHLDDYLTLHGRRLIGWDEILQGGLSPNATVMSWQGVEGGIAAAKAGHDAIMSPSPLLYLNHRQKDAPSEPPGRGMIIRLEDIYRFNPLPDGLNAAESRHIRGLQGNLWSEYMREPNFMTRMAFPRAAALAEIGWTPLARLDWPDFHRRLAVLQRSYPAISLRDDDSYAAWPASPRRYSQQLRLCSEKLPLAIEDDAPQSGPRAVFLLDLINPCWILADQDLKKPTRLTANVGQIPFNFQLGAERAAIKLAPPQSESGELQIRLDDCEGPVFAAISLAPAHADPSVTSLTGAIPAADGRHDLCLRFSAKDIDPLWALNWIQLDSVTP